MSSKGKSIQILTRMKSTPSMKTHINQQTIVQAHKHTLATRKKILTYSNNTIERRIHTNPHKDHINTKHGNTLTNEQLIKHRCIH